MCFVSLPKATGEVKNPMFSSLFRGSRDSVVFQARTGKNFQVKNRGKIMGPVSLMLHISLKITNTVFPHIVSAETILF